MWQFLSRSGKVLYFAVCYISQQIKKLESELGVQLLDRHNHTFSLTPAGEHFYRKSLVITSDIEQLVREVKRMDQNDHVTLHFGYYKGYYGNELTEAVSILSCRRNSHYGRKSRRII